MRKIFPHQAEVIDILRSLYEDHEGSQNIQLHRDINDWIDDKQLLLTLKYMNNGSKR